MADVRLTATNPADSSVVPVACNEKGELKLEEIPDQSFDGDLQGDLTVSGSADFANSVTSGPFNLNANTYGVNINSVGDIRVQRSTGSGNGAEVFEGYIGTARTTLITAGGSAEFAGGLFNVASNGSTEIYRQTTTGTNNALRIYSDVGSTKDEKITFTADGSAEFAGGVNVGTATSRLGNSWGYQIYGGINANGFALYNSGIHNTPSAPYFLRCVVTGVGDTVFVRTDGSAEFAGNKAGFTAEGHLWCTTRRGDTVILDATSNGLASWVPYTPPSRLTELQDRWAEKDGILPVPHDSSQDEPETPQ